MLTKEKEERNAPPVLKLAGWLTLDEINGVLLRSKHSGGRYLKKERKRIVGHACHPKGTMAKKENNDVLP